MACYIEAHAAGVLKTAHQHLRHRLDLPICAMIDRVVRGEIEPSGAYWGLTPAGHEAEPG